MIRVIIEVVFCGLHFELLFVLQEGCIKLSEIGLLPVPVFRIDVPVVQLLEKHGFIILFRKLREYFPIVSEIIEQSLECFAVSVQEYFVFISDFELVHVTEQFLQS